MAQKSGKSKGKKPVSATKKKILSVKKTAVKNKKNVVKKPVVVKKVSVEAKKADKIKEIKEIKKPVIVLQELRMNIRCRSCSSVDGYTTGEKVCHHCRKEIYEIDKT